MLAVCKQLRGLTITVGVVLAALIAATSASAARPLITGVELSSSDALNFSQNMNLAFLLVSGLILVGGLLWLWGARFLEADTKIAPMRLSS